MRLPPCPKLIFVALPRQLKLARRREGSCHEEEEKLIPQQMLEISREYEVDSTPTTVEITKSE